jgi:hypothetical protein
VDPRDRIINEVAKRVCKRITRKVILKLQKMKSVGYSDLHNIWDEICVQKQTEEFTSWEGYANAVRSLVYGFIEKLEDHEQVAIWLQTDLDSVGIGSEWKTLRKRTSRCSVTRKKNTCLSTSTTLLTM